MNATQVSAVCIAMRPYPVFALLFCFLTTAARAEGPLDLLNGYGKTHWGQSVEEVMQLYPAMKETSSPHASQTPVTEPVLPSGHPTVRSLTCPASEPLQSLVFTFYDDQLCGVNAVLSKKESDLITTDELAKIVWAKYYADQEMHRKFDDSNIFIHVGSRQPSTLDRSGGPGSIVFEGSNSLGVSYTKGSLMKQIMDKSKETRQQALEKNAAELKSRDAF